MLLPMQMACMPPAAMVPSGHALADAPAGMGRTPPSAADIQVKGAAAAGQEQLGQGLRGTAQRAGEVTGPSSAARLLTLLAGGGCVPGGKTLPRPDPARLSAITTQAAGTRPYAM